MSKSPACVGVKFQDVSVVKSGKVILDNITAEAPCGGCTVLVGPNGAGKTTLLRCLLGEAHHTGTITFCSPTTCLKPVIGYVPQQLMVDGQMPLRVYEFMALAHAGLPIWLGCANRRKYREFLALAGAEKLEEQRLGELSGGELRRVLLASALSRHPNLLILDEAEAGVDYRGERMFWQLLHKMREQLGFTLLMVSHNLPLAAHYATHVLCIKTALLAEGPPTTTLTSANLLALFGVPIHLYPQQCDHPGPACPQCGALGNLPYLDTGATTNDLEQTG